MRAIEERSRPYAGEHPAVFRLEKWLQIYAGRYPSVFFSLYRLAGKDRARVVTSGHGRIVTHGQGSSGTGMTREATGTPDHQTSYHR